MRRSGRRVGAVAGAELRAPAGGHEQGAEDGQGAGECWCDGHSHGSVLSPGYKLATKPDGDEFSRARQSGLHAPERDYIVQANGVDLAVESFGDRADPAILLIHGAGSSLLNWEEEFCERLAAGRRFVIRYDLRGAGRSVAPGAYSLRDLVADAVGLLDHLGLETAHVLGMSLGGAVAQLLALDHPERVASLILASTTPGGPGHPQPDLPGSRPSSRPSSPTSRRRRTGPIAPP